MADSSSNLDTISASQASKEVTANALYDAGSPATLYGRRASTTSGLTWGYYGGKFRKSSGTIATIANGLVTLTNNATNYLYADEDGVVTKTTTAPPGWPGPLAIGSPADKAIALYQIVVSGGSVTSYTDYRTTDYGFGTSGGSTEPADGNKGDITVGGSPTQWTINVKPIVVGFFYPGVPTASVLVGSFAAPSDISTIIFASSISGSSGKALTAATAQTDFDVRKNATTSANGTSVGTIRFAASGTVPTFIAASGFTLTGGSDWLTVWGPSSPDATLANIGVSLYGTRG